MVYLIIYTLAVYYTVTVVIEEDGPFDVFNKLKNYIGMKRLGLIERDDWQWVDIGDITEDDHIESYRWEDNGKFWGKVMSCHRCLSIYISLLYFPFYLLKPELFIVFSISGLVVYMKEH